MEFKKIYHVPISLENIETCENKIKWLQTDNIGKVHSLIYRCNVSELKLPDGWKLSRTVNYVDVIVEETRRLKESDFNFESAGELDE